MYHLPRRRSAVALWRMFANASKHLPAPDETARVTRFVCPGYSKRLHGPHRPHYQGSKTRRRQRRRAPAPTGNVQRIRSPKPKGHLVSVSDGRTPHDTRVGLYCYDHGTGELGYCDDGGPRAAPSGMVTWTFAPAGCDSARHDASMACRTPRRSREARFPPLVRRQASVCLRRDAQFLCTRLLGRGPIPHRTPHAASTDITPRRRPET